jgi:protein-disulfide isomerase
VHRQGNYGGGVTKLRLIPVVLLAAVLTAGCGILGHGPGGSSAKPTGDAKAIRVASDKLVVKDGSTEPKVVLGLYEDFLCPACHRFEEAFSPTITSLINNGQVAADYYMVAILDRSSNQNYSSRAGAAGYCVAAADTSPDKAGFMRFHAAMYAQQPDETGTSFPTDQQLAETARQAGINGDVAECITSNRNVDMVKGLAKAAGVNSTPTIRINGEDYEPSTPDALVEKVKSITG